MSKTIEIRVNDPGRRPVAQCIEVDERQATLYRGRTFTIRVGFESVTLPDVMLQNLLRATVMASEVGAEYPEDWLPFYGLGEPERLITNTGSQTR